MVAYNFQSRFETSILAGRKIGTIRAVGRRRHARPGEALQLYLGQRSPRCRLIATARCLSVDPIHLSIRSAFISRDGVLVGDGADRYEVEDLDAFARGDGFADWGDLTSFFSGRRGLAPWVGVWVRWDPATVIGGG